jgi:hypothetical protein
MYFISSYFPTRSAVLCIGDTTQYSDNEMRYGAYRDEKGFALNYFRRSLALAKNKSRASQATANVHHQESPHQYQSLAMPCGGGTESRNHDPPSPASYVRRLSD